MASVKEADKTFNFSTSRIFSYANSYGPSVAASYGTLFEDYIDNQLVKTLKKLKDDIQTVSKNPKLAPYGKLEAARSLAEDALNQITTATNKVADKLTKDRNGAILGIPQLPSLAKFAADRARGDFVRGTSQNQVNDFMASRQRDTVELSAIIAASAMCQEIRETLIKMSGSDRAAAVQAAVGQGDKGFLVLIAVQESPPFQQIVPDEVLRECIAKWMCNAFPDAYHALTTVDQALACLQSNVTEAIRCLSDVVKPLAEVLPDELRKVTGKLWGYIPVLENQPRTTDAPQITSGDGLVILKP